jgi:Ca-activated chloride channel homolog
MNIIHRLGQLLLLFLLMTLSLDSAIANSPVSKFRPQPIIWQPPRLIVPPSMRANQPIQLQSVALDVDISGGFAATQIEMIFYNPNPQVLEGELQFPLLAGQTIASFAMDVDGKLREAVSVEKARGQAVFEEIIRGRIDPGLLEVTQGNNFKLRVYPIPGAGQKRVVLRINETLSGTGNGTERLYRLPVAFAQRIAQFKIDVRVVGVDSAPKIGRNPLPNTGALTFSRDSLLKSDTYRLRESFTDLKLGESQLNTSLDIILSSTKNDVIQTERFDGKNYFVADLAANTTNTANQKILPRWSTATLPRIVGLIWDSSASAHAADHARAYALLDRYFGKLQNGEVRLTRIRNDAERTETFTIRQGDWSALKTALQKTDYDGATNLAAFSPEPRVGEYLLFSDGLNNFGDQPFPQTTMPLYAISAAIKADQSFMQHIAERSGGRFIDLTALDIDQASNILLNTSKRVSRIESPGATELLLASPFEQNGRIVVAGVMNDAATTLNVTWRQADGTEETIRIPINMPTEQNSAEKSFAANRWATIKLAKLDAEYHLNRTAIKRLGQRHRLVTRETSLIVLDRVEDYVRYEIEPPNELSKQYAQLSATHLAREQTERRSHLAQVLDKFAAKVKWWQHDFPKGAVFAPKSDNKLSRTEDARASNFASSTPAIINPAAPPIVSAAPIADRARRIEQSAAAPAETVARTATHATSTAIRLQKWQPDAAYAKRLHDASRDDLYRIYLDEAAEHANSTAFFLDAADEFFQREMYSLGVRVLSNLAEMDLENRHILRVLGARLMQARQPQLAIPILKKVLALSPNEPQSYRDLGLAYAANKEPQKAIDTLYEVVIRPWHNRFPEIELISLADMNAIIATSQTKLDVSRIDSRLIQNLSLDLRVVLTWDADNTDIDLWVTDPNGETANYRNQMSYQGGRMSQDFTGGYGPEEFSLKHAKPGKYRIEAQYYGDRRQNVTGATTIQVRLTKGFGTRRGEEEIVTMRLKDRSEMVFVGEFEVKGR